MTLTLEITPEIERALEARARRAGVPVSDYAVRVLVRDAQGEGLEEIAALYAESLATGGELTAATDAGGDIHEYTPEDLEAMERGDFAQPLRRAA